MDPELLSALKALADPTRLRILGLLAGGSLTTEELAAALGETAPSIARHLRRLGDAGLVTAGRRPGAASHELRIDRLAAIGATLDRLEREALAAPDEQPDGDDAAGDASLSRADARVLRSFLVDGRLERIPAGHRKRQVLLRFLARTDFEPGTPYPERDVNMRLALRHPDVASLRRFLVDDGYMERSGGIYRLVPEERWPPPGGSTGA
jgi:hypothetical protein